MRETTGRRKKYLQQKGQQQEASTAARVWPAVCLQSVEAVLPEPARRSERYIDSHTDRLKNKPEVFIRLTYNL